MLHHSTMRDHSTVAYMDQLMCTGESYCTFISKCIVDRDLLCSGTYDDKIHSKYKTLLGMQCK